MIHLNHTILTSCKGYLSLLFIIFISHNVIAQQSSKALPTGTCSFNKIFPFAKLAPHTAQVLNSITVLKTHFLAPNKERKLQLGPNEYHFIKL